MSRRHKKAAAGQAAPPTPAPFNPIAWLRAWLTGPQPIERLALVRILVPLAVLFFLSSRLAHVSEWLTPAGFHVPDLGGDWRQPLYLPPISYGAALVVAVATTVTGLLLVVGLWTRPAALAFALLVAYLDLADRLEAFTVTKLAPLLCLALFVSPCSARYALDAWLRRRKIPGALPPTHVPGGSVRFFQVFLVTMYSGSGLAKVRGDWLHANVLWSQLHDQYQTQVSWLLAGALPGWSWIAMQALVLTFEVGAPLWFALPWTRTPALVVGLGMHAMIGLMFGPVVWFAMLMGSLLLASYAPEPLLRWIFGAPGRVEARLRRGATADPSSANPRD